MLRRFSSFGFTAVLVLAQAACTEDPEVPEASLHGTWTVVSATRGGRATNTLDKAYFRFDTATHELTTNFTGEPLGLEFERQGNQVTTKGSVLLNSLDLTKLNDSSLAFRTEIRGVDFAFELQGPQAAPRDEAEEL